MTRECLERGGGYLVFFKVGDKWHAWRSKDNDGADDKGYEVRLQPSAESAGKALVAAIEKGVEQDVVDFDCHLDDPSLDMFNGPLHKQIDAK